MANQPIDDYQREADFLATLLEHPDVPAEFEEYISDLVLELTSKTTLFTPAVLRVAWPLIRRESGNEGDGVWDALKIALRAFADEEANQVMDEVSKSLYARRTQPKRKL